MKMQSKTRLQNIQQQTNSIQKIQQIMAYYTSDHKYHHAWQESEKIPCEHPHNAGIQVIKLWLGRSGPT